MNKRDYFAAQAMQAIIAKRPLEVMHFFSDDFDEDLFDWVANGAYLYADAMLEARKEG